MKANKVNSAGRRGVFPKYGSVVRQLYVEKGLKLSDICRTMRDLFPNAPDLPAEKTIERWISENHWEDDRKFFSTSMASIENDVRQIASEWINLKKQQLRDDPQTFVASPLADDLAKIAKSLLVIQKQKDPKRDMVNFLEAFVPFMKSLNPEPDKLAWFGDMISEYQETLGQ